MKSIIVTVAGIAATATVLLAAPAASYAQSSHSTLTRAQVRQELFDLESVGLGFTDDALVAVSKKAIDRKTGARGLRSILEGILLDTMFDLPGMDGVDEVMIDKDVIEGRKDPIRVYAHKEKAGDAA